MMGLTDEQVQELKLKDDWEDKCVPQGGFKFCKDDVGRRNGKGTLQTMVFVLQAYVMVMTVCTFTIDTSAIAT